MVRAISLAGGAAFIQRGGFYAAAPWRSIQATPSTFRGAFIGGGMGGRKGQNENPGGHDL
jgi:hypothetical protein